MASFKRIQYKGKEETYYCTDTWDAVYNFFHSDKALVPIGREIRIERAEIDPKTHRHGIENWNIFDKYGWSVDSTFQVKTIY